jgi:hypothetical protein
MIKNSKPFFFKPVWANANACQSHAGKFCITLDGVFCDLPGRQYAYFFTITLIDVDDLIHSGNRVR